MGISSIGDRGLIVVNDVIFAGEGQALLRIEAGTAERIVLGERILDVVGSEHGIFVLGETHIFALSPDGRVIRNRVRGSGERLHLQPDRLILLASAGGVRVFEISPEGRLTPLARTDTPGEAYDAALSPAGVLGVADGIAGTRFYILEDGYRAVGEFIGQEPFTRIVADPANEIFYASSTHAVTIIDVADPVNPQVLGHYAPAEAIVDGVRVNGLTVFADRFTGLKVYQNTRYLRGEVDNPALGVAQLNSQLVALRSRALTVYDVTQLPTIERVRQIPLWAEPTAIATLPGRNLFAVGLGAEGLAFFDGFNIQAVLSVRGTITDITAQGDQVYLTLQDGRLLTLNIANLDAPQVLDIQEVTGSPQQVAISESHLAVAAGSGGFHIFAVSENGLPQRQLILPPADFATSVSFLGDQLLLLDGSQVRMLTNATWIETRQVETVPGFLLESIAAGGNQFSNGVNTYTAPLDFVDVRYQNGDLIVIGRNGIAEIDVSNPRVPLERRFTPLPTDFQAVAQFGSDWITTNGSRIMNGDLVVYQPNRFDTALILENYSELQAQTAAQVNGQWWLGGSDGKLWQINGNTPQLRHQFDAPVTALATLGNALYVGTSAGTVERWPELTTTFGHPIRALLALPDNRLGVVGDRLWIVNPDLTIAHELDATAAAIHNDELAIAQGACGLTILDYPSLAEQAHYPIGVVADVAYRSGELWVLQNGVFQPVDRTVEFMPPAPYHPSPPSGYVSQTPPSQLIWFPQPTDCMPYRYELRINGQAVASLDEASYTLSTPLPDGTEWQVVLVESDGTRVEGETWRYDSPDSGWMNAPQNQTLRLSPAPTATPNTFPWMALILVVLGVIGFGWLARRIWEGAA